MGLGLGFGTHVDESGSLMKFHMPSFASARMSRICSLVDAASSSGGAAMSANDRFELFCAMRGLKPPTLEPGELRDESCRERVGATRPRNAQPSPLSHTASS